MRISDWSSDVCSSDLAGSERCTARSNHGCQAMLSRLAGSNLGGQSRAVGRHARCHRRRSRRSCGLHLDRACTKATLAQAALINGSTGHALAYDDGIVPMVHPTVPVSPVAFALGERGALSGKNTLPAFLDVG